MRPPGVFANLSAYPPDGSTPAHPCTVRCEVRLVDSRITGSVRVMGASVSNPDGVAVNLDRAEVTGGVRAVAFGRRVAWRTCVTALVRWPERVQ